MERIGYFARSKSNGNLYRFEWSSDDTFRIVTSENVKEEVDPEDYEILEIFHSAG